VQSLLVLEVNEMDVFKKAQEAYRLIRKEVKLDGEELVKTIGRVANGSKLTKDELKIYELLLAKKLNPNTVYRWFLATTAPDHIRTKLRSGQISIRDALHMRNKIRSNFTTNDSDIIREVIWHIEEYIL
jgi:hypothetical protein